MLSLAVCSRVASAQGTIGPDIFGLPGAMMMCRALQVGPADSAAFAIEFMDSPFRDGERTSNAYFDFSGKPLYMTVSASGTTPAGEYQVRIAVVRFFPKAMGGMSFVSGTPPAPGRPDSSAPIIRHPETQLTDAEVSRAKALAEWFWTHRCNRARGDPPPPIS